MDDHDESLARFEQLLERSSLGSPGAQQLRRRTPSADIAAARRIHQLRDRMVHTNDADATTVAVELIDYLTELGYHGQAR